MNNILNEEERGKLLSSLADAPDEILLDAVRQKKEWRCRIQSDFEALKGFIGARKVEPVVVAEGKKAMAEEAAPVSSAKIEPPGTATKAIKTATAEKIAKALETRPRGEEELRRILAAPLEHTRNLMRLLWEREAVLFDGEKYRINN